MLRGPKPTQRRASDLRRDLTLPEVLLWQVLRQRSGGFKFRRQHPAGPYVLDFFCAAAKLAVEVEGKAHDMGDRPERDDVRDASIARHGVLMLRISATDVLRDLDGVVARITATAVSRT